MCVSARCLRLHLQQQPRLAAEKDRPGARPPVLRPRMHRCQSALGGTLQRRASRRCLFCGVCWPRTTARFVFHHPFSLPAARRRDSQASVPACQPMQRARPAARLPGCQAAWAWLRAGRRPCARPLALRVPEAASLGTPNQANESPVHPSPGGPTRFPWPNCLPLRCSASTSPLSSLCYR